MPDASGWPLPQEVYAKIRLIAPDGVTLKNQGDIGPLLSSVIAEFQSPAGIDRRGGTGRSFTPVNETRTYDGHGGYELVVEDIVPGTVVSVSSFGALLDNVLVRENRRGGGYNVLVRPQGVPLSSGSSYLASATFPTGVQNIQVTATWGYAAQVPADVYEAVRCEVARRAIIQGDVVLEGLGSIISVGQGDIEVNTAAGVSIWGQSSPIAMLGNVYKAAIMRYRVSDAQKLKTLAGRMS